MSKPDPLIPLIGAIRALLRWLSSTKTPGVVIGGVAASLLGRPRLTGDVDAMVLLDEAAWSAFVEAGRPFGVVPRRRDALAFARRSRVLLLHHQPSGIDLDVSLGALPFEAEMIARARRRRIGSLSIPLPVPEDLIVMKAIAGRPRDVADIESILEANPRINETRVVDVVREFAALLEAPDLVTDLEELFDRRRRDRQHRSPRSGVHSRRNKPGRGPKRRP